MKVSGGTRLVKPSTQSRVQSVSDFNNAMKSGDYDIDLSYLPPIGNGTMLYQLLAIQ